MFTMRRARSFLLSALVIMLAGVCAYWIKSQAIEKEERLEVIEARINAEKDRIMVLEADWSYLTSPDRIQRLSGEMLSFAPVEPERILTLDHLGNDAFKEERTNPVSAGLFRITTGGGTE